MKKVNSACSWGGLELQAIEITNFQKCACFRLGVGGLPRSFFQGYKKICTFNGGARAANGLRASHHTLYKVDPLALPRHIEEPIKRWL